MTWTHDQERHEAKCIAYLRLVFGSSVTAITELARIQALQRAAHAIMTAPGGRA